MSIESLIATYGYIALFAGAILEGETVVLIAGMLALRGYLDLQWVMLVSFAGAFLGDQTVFFIGRRFGIGYLERKPHWRPRVRKARVLINHYQIPLLIGFRFFYGLRNVTAFVVGASRYKVKRFVLLNAVGAAIWACVVGGAGYFLGFLLESILEDIKKYEIWMVSGLAVIGISIWLIRRRKWMNENRTSPAEGVDRPLSQR